MEAEQHTTMWLIAPGEPDYVFSWMVFAGPTTDKVLHTPSQPTSAKAHPAGKGAQNGKATQAQRPNLLVYT